MAVVDELVTLLTLKPSPGSAGVARRFSDGLKRIEKTAKLATLAIAGVSAGIYKMTIGLSEQADQLAKHARAIGIDIELLQELRYAGERSGASIGAVDNSMRRFIQGIGEAAAGTGEAKDAFKQMSISLHDSAGNIRSTEDLLNDVSDALKGMDNATRVAIANDLFGRGGVTFLNALLDDMDKLRARARELGFIITDEQAKKAEDLQDSLLDVGRVMRGLRYTIAARLWPQMENLNRSFIDFIVRNRELIETRIVEFMTGVGLGFQRLGRAVQNALDYFAQFLPNLDVFGEKMTLTEKVALAVQAVFGALALALTPLITRVALLAARWGLLFAIIEDVIEYFRGGADTFIGPWIEKFKEWTGASEGLAQAIALVGAALAGAFLLAPLRTIGLLIGGFKLLAKGMLALPVIKWARHIPKISWLALAGTLKWSTLIKPLAWAALRVIPVIGWVALAGGLLWKFLIEPLGWDDWIYKIEWSQWLSSLEWSDWLPKVNWEDWLSSLEWSDWLPKVNWEDWLPTVDWARVFNGLDAFIERIKSMIAGIFPDWLKSALDINLTTSASASSVPNTGQVASTGSLPSVAPTHAQPETLVAAVAPAASIASAVQAVLPAIKVVAEYADQPVEAQSEPQNQYIRQTDNSQFTATFNITDATDAKAVAAEVERNIRSMQAKRGFDMRTESQTISPGLNTQVVD